MKFKFAALCAIFLLNACTVVHYQGIAQSKDGALNISGAEKGFSSNPKAVVLECDADGPSDYVCNKRYPGDSVDMFGNAKMTRDDS